MRGPYTLCSRPTIALPPRAGTPCSTAASPNILLAAYVDRWDLMSETITGAVSAVGTAPRPADTASAYTSEVDEKTSRASWGNRSTVYSVVNVLTFTTRAGSAVTLRTPTTPAKW